MSENTVPFRYTLRPIPSQTAYVPVVGEPYNPPAPQFSLHLQVQLPQADPPLGNRDYGLAVDWPNSAGMRASANKVQSLASNKTYNAGVLELTEDGALMAHYKGEDGVEWHNKLEGKPAEYIIAALTKLFNHDYNVAPVQLEDENEEPGDDSNENPFGVTWPSVGDQSDGEEEDDEEEDDEEDEYDLYED